MLPLKPLAVTSSLFLAACVSPPVKPVVDLCQLDVPAQEGVCGPTEGSDPLRRVPVAELDRATCFAPVEWEKVQVYIDLMEKYVREQCRK